MWLFQIDSWDEYYLAKRKDEDKKDEKEETKDEKEKVSAMGG